MRSTLAAGIKIMSDWCRDNTMFTCGNCTMLGICWSLFVQKFHHGIEKYILVITLTFIISHNKNNNFINE